MRKVKNQKTYYVICGCNGVGIYSSYTKALATQQYIKKWNCKKCISFDEAVDFAIDCTDSAYTDKYLIIPREHFKLNFTLFYGKYL